MSTQTDDSTSTFVSVDQYGLPVAEAAPLVLLVGQGSSSPLLQNLVEYALSPLGGDQSVSSSALLKDIETFETSILQSSWPEARKSRLIGQLTDLGLVIRHLSDLPAGGGREEGKISFRHIVEAVASESEMAIDWSELEARIRDLEHQSPETASTPINLELIQSQQELKEQLQESQQQRMDFVARLLGPFYSFVSDVVGYLAETDVQRFWKGPALSFYGMRLHPQSGVTDLFRGFLGNLQGYTQHEAAMAIDSRTTAVERHGEALNILCEFFRRDLTHTPTTQGELQETALRLIGGLEGTAFLHNEDAARQFTMDIALTFVSPNVKAAIHEAFWWIQHHARKSQAKLFDLITSPHNSIASMFAKYVSLFMTRSRALNPRQWMKHEPIQRQADDEILEYTLRFQNLYYLDGELHLEVGFPRVVAPPRETFPDLY